MLRRATFYAVIIALTLAGQAIAGDIDQTVVYAPVNLSTAHWNDTITVSFDLDGNAYNSFVTTCNGFEFTVYPTYYLRDPVTNTEYDLSVEDHVEHLYFGPGGSDSDNGTFSIPLSNSAVPAGSYQLHMKARGWTTEFCGNTTCHFTSNIDFIGLTTHSQSLDDDNGLVQFTTDILLGTVANYSGPPTYHCVVDTVSPSDNCNHADVNVLGYPSGSDQRQVIVDLDATETWQSMVVRVEVCNPTDWSVHIGDSPTNNGYAGDGASTQHDAEVQSLGGLVSIYASDLFSSRLMHQFSNPVSGCKVQQYYVANDWFIFDYDASISNPLNYSYNPYSFDFPTYDEADLEDPTGAYEDYLYIGLNRTYGAAWRSGSGVERACFYLSASVSVDEGDIDTACGF